MSRSPAPKRKSPRISVNELASFMVSSDSARIGIIKRAKHPKTPPIIRYTDARGPICNYLTDNSRSVNPLLQAEQMFEQRAVDPAESSLRQDDARQSVEVLHAVQKMANQLGGYRFTHAPKKQEKLIISDVIVSVRADLLVHAESRGVKSIGAGILRLTKDDATTPAAIERRKNMGLYVATLARMHLEANFTTDQVVANRLCLSIDVQHGEIFAAPNSNTRRMNDIENACRFISSLWMEI